MAQVPIYNQPTVGDKHTAQIYDNINLNRDMIGAGIMRANALLGKVGADFSDKVKAQLDQYQKTKVTELSNMLDSHINQALFDTENGYMYKTGKNAAGQSPLVLQAYDEYSQKLLKESGLSGIYKDAAINMMSATRNRLYENVTKYDYQQTRAWQNTTYEEKQNNLLNRAIIDRNDDKLINEDYRQLKNAIVLQGQLQGWDNDTVNLKITESTSKFHEGVIGAMLSDGNLRAGSYYTIHKSEISPDRQTAIINAINGNERKYKTRTLADNIYSRFSSDEAGGYKELEKQKKNLTIDEYDQTQQRLSQSYSMQNHLKSAKESKALESFYQTILDKQKNGQMPSLDDITPEISANISPETELSLRKFIASNGNPETDNQIWEQLQNMSVYNAQGFANEDLNKYRGYLSDSEYKSFYNRQQDIKSGKYNTSLNKDFDDKIKAELKNINLGFRGDKDLALNEIHSFVRETEARRGRKITDAELDNFIQSMGYKGKNGYMYRLYEQGLKLKTDFMKDCVNDMVYWQSKHEGQMVTDEVMYGIVNKRAAQYSQHANDGMISALSNSIPTSPKVGDYWQGHRITSTFGTRVSPTTGASTNHQGVDLAYKMNEPFQAFASGTVISTTKGSRSFGNYVDIRSADGTIHRYAHANQINVKVGDKVNAGQVIGLAGSTGISTGPHLHYEKLQNGKHVSPYGNSATVPVANKISSSYAEGTIIRNPKTGERKIMKGGKWQTI